MLATGPTTRANVSCERGHRRLLDLMEQIKAAAGTGLQCREGLLDGQRVVIVGVANDGFEPECVVLDDAVASQLGFGGPEPDEPA